VIPGRGRGSRFSNRTHARRQRNDPEFCPVSVP
jgi:hypothetical protein